MKVNKSDYYLLCNYRFSESYIETIKADVKRFMTEKEKDDIYFKFINWQRKDNELAVLTMYAYDDIQLPRKFDTIFQIDEPANFIHIAFTITQSVFNAYAPLNQIKRGHKQVCVLEFYGDIPRIFNSIPLFDHKTTSQKEIRLGFCDRNNFESIKANLRQT